MSGYSNKIEVASRVIADAQLVGFGNTKIALAQLRAANAFLAPHEGRLRMLERVGA